MMKLLLVDGHPLFGVGFVHAISRVGVGIHVDTALAVDDGLQQAVCGGYDIVLIDYRLQHCDGIEGLRRFGARFPSIARVLISGDDDPALAARARAAGAMGFLGKSLPIDALLSALGAIARGEMVFGPVGALRPPRAGPRPTPRQLEVLSLVAQGQPNKRIASEQGIAERTVKLHVTALLDALGARNRTHLLVVARDTGVL